MLGVLVVAMASIFVISKQTEAQNTDLLKKQASQLLTNLAGSVALQVGNQVLQYRFDSRQVATDPEVINFMQETPDQQAANGSNLLRRLAPGLTSDPDYRLLLVLDPNGKVVISNEPGVQGQDFSDRQFFIQGKAA